MDRTFDFIKQVIYIEINTNVKYIKLFYAMEIITTKLFDILLLYINPKTQKKIKNIDDRPARAAETFF